MLHVPLPGGNSALCPEVLFRATADQFFIREDGRTHPASLAQVASRFGPIFAECVHDNPGCWLVFDDDARADIARVLSNRNRYEAVGLALLSLKYGKPCFGVYDHVRDRIFHCHMITWKDAIRAVDQVDCRQPRVLPEAEALYRAMRAIQERDDKRSTPVVIATGNVAAVEAVAALF